MSTALADVFIRKTEGVLERLIQRSVMTTDGCQLWTGATRGAGYGAIKVDGRAMAVHQVAYILATGSPIPRGQLVRHTCGRSLCICPYHLELGNDRDNALDALAHGTSPARNQSPIDPEARRAVLVLSENEFSRHEIHRLLGLPLSTVKTIVRRGA